MSSFIASFLSLSLEEREYFMLYSPTKLKEVSELKMLHHLLTNFEFLEQKVSRFGPQSLIDDYDLSDEKTPRFIQKTLRQEAHILETYPQLLWQQLYNRLQFEKGVNPHILQVELERRSRLDAQPWLRLIGSPGPENSFIRTLPIGDVVSVAFSPDGRLLLTGSSSDGTVELWEVSSGRELKRLQGHTSRVSSVTFSLDGQLALTGSYDGTVRLWEVSSGRELRCMQHAGIEKLVTVTDVALSPNGRLALAGYAEGAAYIWEVNGGREIQRLSVKTEDRFNFTWGPDSIRSVAFSPNGRMVLTGSDDETVRLWDISSGRELLCLLAHTSTMGRDLFTKARSVAFSPDGSIICAGSNDRTACLWDAGSGRLLRQLQGHTGRVHSVAFSSDGRLIATGSADHTVRLWEVSSGRELRRQEVQYNGTMAFSSDGRLIATNNIIDHTVKLWDISNIDEQTRQEDHIAQESRMGVMAFSPDGRLILALVRNAHYEVCLCEISTGRKYREFKGRFPFRPGEFVNTGAYGVYARFSHKGHLLLTQLARDPARLWDVRTGRKYRQFHLNDITSAVFSPDDQLIATISSDGIARLWQVRRGRLLQQLEYHQRIHSVTFSPDGCLVLVGLTDGKIGLWEVSNRRERMQVQAHTGPVVSVEFSPKGDIICTTGSEGTACLWEVSTGRELKRLQGRVSDPAFSAFSPDGRLIIIHEPNDNNRYQIWQTQDPKREKLLGFYPAGDHFLFWRDTTHLSFWASAFELGKPLRFCHLALEGNWK